MSDVEYSEYIDESTPTFQEFHSFGKGNYVIRVCSFNVNCKFNKNQIYDSWLFSEHDADIIAIGFQELYFNLKDVIAPETLFETKITVSAHLKWIALFSSIKSLRNYTLVTSKTFSALCLFIFIKKSRIKNPAQPVSNIMVGSFPLGMLGMANKGGLSIAFRFEDISLCFINCHFPSGAENSSKRQQCMQTIFQKLQLHHTEKSKKINFIEAEFDLVFLFGDLNFRLQNTTLEAVTKKIKEKNLCTVEKILKWDELMKGKEKDLLYRSFYEGQIKFFPTYKFIINSNNYNPKRVPSYCDRILWMGNKCVNISYSCHPEITISDHLPVSGDFFIDGTICSHAFTSNYRKSRELPAVKIANTNINFGDVYFLTNHFCDTKIENIASVESEVTFKNLRSFQSMPTWFTIIPSSFILGPKTSRIIQFRIFIDCDNVVNFNMDKDNINRTIVYAFVNNGASIALQFHGEYHLSLFGIHLEYFQFFKRPLDTYISSEILQFGRCRSRRGSLPHSEHELLKKIMDLLMPNITITERFSDFLLNQENDIDERLQFINNISNLDITNLSKEVKETHFKVGTYIEVLLIFIKCLPQPIIPFVIQARLAANPTNTHHILKVLHNLPKTSILLLRQLTHFLHNFIKCNEDIEFMANFVVTCIPPSSQSLKSPLVDTLSLLIKKPQML